MNTLLWIYCLRRLSSQLNTMFIENLTLKWSYAVAKPDSVKVATARRLSFSLRLAKLL